VDTLTSYRQIIKRVLLEYLALVGRGSPKSEVEDIRLFDDETNSYMVYRVGWHKNRRVHDASILVRIVNGKVWLEVDWTDEVIAQQLIDAGIPAEDMRYGFHHPLLRDEPAGAVA